MLDPLTLDQLRVLVAVAETGSFSAAARRLGRVRSAVSLAIQSLESTLQLELFDRSSRLPRLTRAGEVVLADARQVLGSSNRLKARAVDLRSGLEPELGVSVEAAFLMPVFLASLSRLREAFPLLPVSIFTEVLGAPERRLRSGEANIAICILDPAALPSDCGASFLTTIPIVPVAAANHPLARERSPLTREHLEKYVKLSLLDSPAPEDLAPTLSGAGTLPTWRFADMSVRLEFLLAGFGWCNMPLHLAEPHLRAERIVRLNVADKASRIGSLDMYAVHSHARPLGRAGRFLVEDLSQRLIPAADPLPAEAPVTNPDG